MSMSNKISLDAATIKKLLPGAWVWVGGIGYRRNQNDEGGAWYIKYRAPMPGHYGKHLSAPLRQVKERLPNCRNRSQAEGVLMARKAAIFEGHYQRKRKAETTTIKSFADKFLESKRHLRTVKEYRQQLELHIIPHFGSKPIEAISSQDCYFYYNKRLDTTAAVSTVNGELACLKSLFSEAIRTGLIKINPVKGIKFLNPNNVRDRILSNEETARLFNAAEGTADFIRPLFHMLFHTGMRLGEALALEWADVEFEHQRIVVRKSKSGEGRKIPLRGALADELIQRKPHSRESRWVFPARYDIAQPMQSIRKGWLRLCTKANVSILRPHDLRHNFTSQLQAAGVADSIIMSITGHKTHVMLHRYSHANDDHKRKALDALPDHQVVISDSVVSIRRART
jgi:integrase